MFKEEVLHHKNDKITMDGVDFNAHIFFNEKAAINFKHHIYSSIFKAEESLDFKIKFNNAEELNQYAEEQIISKLRKYFKVDESSMSIKRDYDAINNEIFKAGAFVMIVNGETQDKMQIIEYYRNRDEVEKDMHSLKNELDGKRIRAHNSHTANGRIFVKFLAMIIRAKIINVIKKHEKLKNYSVNEIFAELRKLKVNCFDEDNNFITEITKKQKTIFEAFSISDKVILEHGY